MTPCVVLDSNVWVSALISPRGQSATIVRAVLAGAPAGIISAHILGEIDRALSKKWFAEHFGIGEEDILSYLSLIRSRLEMVTPVAVNLALRDADDSPILGTALAGKVSYLVTGDHDLLDDPDLLAWMLDQGVKIISPANFSR